MRASVRDNFVPFTAPLEGVVRWFYADVKGLITIAIGNLVDPVESALSLAMVHKGTDIPASQADIRADWLRVKSDPNAARLGHRSVEALTNLRLTDAGVDAVVNKRLALNDQILRTRFPDFEKWPADAQLATHSMAWACGPYFRFAKLEAALKLRDFSTAATECYMNTTGNPGLVPRNGANKALYNAAADPNRDDDAVTWSVLTAQNAKLWPARPANDTAPLVEPGSVIRPPLPPWPMSRDDDEPPPDAA